MWISWVLPVQKKLPHLSFPGIVAYETPEKELAQKDLGLLQYHICGEEVVIFQEEYSRLRTQKL
jgi:hypothetical protein